MLQEKYDVSSEEGLKKLMHDVIETSLKYLDEKHKDTFLFHINAKTVEELELDESRAIGFQYEY